MAGSFYIYLTAEIASAPELGYEVQVTKKYLRDLEVYGGKANVLAVEFVISHFILIYSSFQCYKQTTTGRLNYLNRGKNVEKSQKHDKNSSYVLC
jgi:hypothetical protein